MVASPAESYASPHAHLLSAFKALKKEKNSLVALNALQIKDKDALVVELEAAKEALVAETTKVKKEKDSLVALNALQTKNKEALVVEIEAAKEALAGETAKVKKEKDSLVALKSALLQTTDKDALIVELEAAKEALTTETNKVYALEAQVLKREAEAEIESSSNSKDDNDLIILENAYLTRKNEELSEKILDLEFYIEESKEEKESLLKRAGVLARRDQIQKASIKTSNQEITNLMETIEDFQDRFSSLAVLVEKRELLQSDMNETVSVKDYIFVTAKAKAAHKISNIISSSPVEHEHEHEHERVDEDDERREESESELESPLEDKMKEKEQQHEQERAKWIADKHEMFERITTLEALCDEIQTREKDMKSKFILTLAKHRSQWRFENEKLNKEIADLVLEKDTIEAQVEEIAELLEKENNECDADIDFGMINETVTEEESIDGFEEEDMIEKSRDRKSRDPPIESQ